MTDTELLESVAQVLKNEGSSPERWPKVKILGSFEALTDAVNMATQRSGMINLVTAACILKYCLEENHSSEQVAAFKEGLESFNTFLLECTDEYRQIQEAASKKQSEAGDTQVSSAS